MDSCTTYNFLSQTVANSAGMCPAKARRQKKAAAQPPAIATVNGELLRTTAVMQHIVCMHNSDGVKHCHAIKFVVADIPGYDVISGMAWLRKQNQDIRSDMGIWHWRTHTDAEDGPSCLVSTSTFVATMRAECTQACELYLTDFSLEVSCVLAGNVLMATGPELTVLEAYGTYSGMIFEANSESMPSHGP
jgi:hypothetical protein